MGESSFGNGEDNTQRDINYVLGAGRLSAAEVFDGPALEPQVSATSPSEYLQAEGFQGAVQAELNVGTSIPRIPARVLDSGVTTGLDGSSLLVWHGRSELIDPHYKTN